MKSIALVLILLAAVFSGCRSHKEVYELPERQYPATWHLFCDTRGYNAEEMTGDRVDEYLDTWVGSTEEETVLIAAGIEP